MHAELCRYTAGMLDVEFRVKNYRCFGDQPTSFRVQNGFTALVGTNNSGKSSLLRFPYEIRQLFGLLGSRNGSQLRSNLSTGQQSTWAPNLLAGERAVRAGSTRPMSVEIIVHDGPSGPFNEDGKPVILSAQYVNGVAASLSLSGASFADSDAMTTSTDEFFAPLMAAMDVFADTMYIGPFRNAIHVGSNNQYYDIQTGELFISAFNNFKTGASPDHNEAVYEMTEELRRIFGYDQLEINAAGNTLQLMVDGKSYRLSELGAGLAHFIVVMVNVLVRKPKLLLIDEPELNLHASLQLDFLQTLARYTEHGVIFATHSLGLARTAADTIYTLEKPKGGTAILRLYEDNQDLVTLLGQLSFDSRPELGFSKVLLVEGKTELRALMQFLRLYEKEHEVLMVPLHGAEFIRGDSQQELAELLRIGGKVHYLIDSERLNEGDPLEPTRQAFVEVCSELDIPGLVLERRALENYFTDDAVKEEFGDSARALYLYEKLADSSNRAWRKTNNWRVASRMQKSDLSGTDLGEFLEAL